jgi:N-acetyl-gamma-glutamyl-phosphate reductase
MSKKIKVGIVGATGYAGEELLRLLLGHPHAEITYIAAKIEKEEKIENIFPQFRGKVSLMCENLDIEKLSSLCDAAFLALPHKVSLQVVPSLIEKGLKVIDLSADFRFKNKDTYEKWYGVKHSGEKFLKDAVYGLTEIYRDKIKGSNLVGNPGCYPTAVALAAFPLLKEGLVKPSAIIADAKSGVSGAGRVENLKLIHAECHESVKAYNVTLHRHQPEMEEVLSHLTGEDVSIIFSPHLIPMNRGILATVYLELKELIGIKEMREIFLKYYKGESFIRLFPQGELPETRFVRGTNNCELGLVLSEKTGHVIVVSAIDNLVKGASGQAVQNMNLMCGFPEETGLTNLPVLP